MGDNRHARIFSFELEDCAIAFIGHEDLNKIRRDRCGLLFPVADRQRLGRNTMSAAAIMQQQQSAGA
ncbi:hypothetical protein J7T55_010714 [Diaporthe amygdali]|uniref:uncharacterized protein n=1 Tax=Phomopsis amygdali TaxID=1214568 RepID=UPI0022FEF0C0|nr:uncharacterized protein J7T55_010714 [Diaporthe amygdali]KAJ0114325.1 hypothetical protein J7T55_010714 [Diaporthe amygdali]